MAGAKKEHKPVVLTFVGPAKHVLIENGQAIEPGETFEVTQERAEQLLALGLDVVIGPVAEPAILEEPATPASNPPVDGDVEGQGERKEADNDA